MRNISLIIQSEKRESPVILPIYKFLIIDNRIFYRSL